MALVKYKVTADKLNVRTRPSTESKVITTLKQGTLVDVVRGKSKVVKGTKWFKIKLNSKYCWACAKYMKRVSPRYRTLVLQKAKLVYQTIIDYGCKHANGAKTLSQIKTKKVTTCATAVSVALQEAGVLRKGTIISHTKAVGGSNALKKKNTIKKAISGTKNLIPGTYKIVKVGKVYKNMSGLYKKPGNVLVYDSNIAIIRDLDSMYSCNNGKSQINSQGRYKSNISKSGYNFTSPILYCIFIYT